VLCSQYLIIMTLYQHYAYRLHTMLPNLLLKLSKLSMSTRTYCGVNGSSIRSGERMLRGIYDSSLSRRLLAQGRRQNFDNHISLYHSNCAVHRDKSSTTTTKHVVNFRTSIKLVPMLKGYMVDPGSVKSLSIDVSEFEVRGMQTKTEESGESRLRVKLNNMDFFRAILQSPDVKQHVAHLPVTDWKAQIYMGYDEYRIFHGYYDYECLLYHDYWEVPLSCVTADHTTLVYYPIKDPRNVLRKPPQRSCLDIGRTPLILLDVDGVINCRIHVPYLGYGVSLDRKHVDPKRDELFSRH